MAAQMFLLAIYVVALMLVVSITYGPSGDTLIAITAVVIASAIGYY